ncbi:MAG: substrate-binding domain-containing protein, partial [Chloroflexota bacterium]|nr:substrate-binding domain-containing protein [Chloroflexota bacterium]
MFTKRNKGWITVVLAGLLVMVLGVAGCNGTTGDEDGLSGSIKIIGSNTVTPLASVWAEEFMGMHPGVNIAVSGPGSGAGIASLINGTTDICQASREIKESEIEQAEANGVYPYEIVVATDSLSVIVHDDNPVSE